MGKILIKNKKGSHEKPAQKKTSPAAADQTTTTAAPAQDPNATPQDPANPAPSTQETQGGLEELQVRSGYVPKQACLVISLTLCLHVSSEGDAAAEDNEEQEDTEEQDEEKMKTSDEVKNAAVVTVLLLHIIRIL